MTRHWIEDLRYTVESFDSETGSRLDIPARLHDLGPDDAPERSGRALGGVCHLPPSVFSRYRRHGQHHPQKVPAKATAMLFSAAMWLFALVVQSDRQRGRCDDTVDIRADSNHSAARHRLSARERSMNQMVPTADVAALKDLGIFSANYLTLDIQGYELDAVLGAKKDY